MINYRFLSSGAARHKGLGGLSPPPPQIKLSREKNNDTLCTVQCASPPNKI